MNHIPPEVTAALEALTVPYEVRKGGKHVKLYVSGHLVGVLPFGPVKDRDVRTLKNTLAQIRRAAAGQFVRNAKEEVK